MSGTGLLLLLAVSALYFLVRSWLINEFDHTLEIKARALITLTEQEAQGVEFDFADEYIPEFENRDEPEYFQIWVNGANVLERSRSLGDSDLPHIKPRDTQPRYRDLDLPSGSRERLIYMDFVPQVDDDSSEDVDVPLDPTVESEHMELHVASIAVARSREGLDSRLVALRVGLAVFVGVFLVSTAWLIATVLRIGLRPLELAAHQVRNLDENSLDQGIAIGSRPKELEPLLKYLSNLLVRLHDAIIRERTLSSDIAHELRTPIAELRSLAEIGARWPEDTAMVRQYFADSRSIARQMEHVVVNLLSLARLEAGIEQVNGTPFLLALAISNCWRVVEKRAVERNMNLQLEVLHGCEVETDQGKFEIIVTNLLSNAVMHGQQGQDVLCAAIEGDRCTALTITNKVRELDESDLPYLFDRFWRKDAARPVGEHAGLGLAIVRGLSRLLNIELSVSLDAAANFRISLEIPRPPQSETTSGGVRA